MKILYVCPDLGIPVLGRKGASVHVRGLVSAFSRAGHRVVLAAPMLNKSPWEEPAKVEASVLVLPPSAEVLNVVFALKAFNETLGVANSLPGEIRRILHDQEFGVQLKRRFDSDPPDFIYERASLYATAGAMLRRELDRPLLVELNAPLAVEQSIYRVTGLGQLAAQAERWNLAQADAVLAVSSPLREYAVSLGANPEVVHVLPNGVDPTVFKPGARDPSVRPRWNMGDGPVLGFVGGLRSWHGVGALPSLVERLLGRYPDLRLVLVGDGPLREELEYDVRQRGLTESVAFTGSVAHEEIPPLIREFDVALAPYAQPEHSFYFSPLKIFEYMACGAAVVAANLGQIAEVVTPDETGLLYSPGDIDGLTEACDRLLANPGLRDRLGQAAAAQTRNQHTWDQNAARVVDLARSLIEARLLEPVHSEDGAAAKRGESAEAGAWA